MPTWRDLGRQRLRWYRGALENLRAYGWTPVTRRYWGQQAMLSVGVLALWLYLSLTVASFALGYRFGLNPYGMALGGVFLVERVVTVWRGGWNARALAATMYLELLYEMFLQLVFLRAVADALVQREATWHHVTATTK